MKAICISCFNYYDNRLTHVDKLLTDQGYDVTYITSDFDHIAKVKYKIDRPNTIQIKVNPYYKNLSIQRLLSHYIFSAKVFKQVRKIKPDLLYVMFPPNSLVKFLSKYKKKNKVKLIYDVYDLWPETFPSSQKIKILSLPFAIWRNLRDKNIKAADIVVVECGLYIEKLKHLLAGMNVDILYLTKKRSGYKQNTTVHIEQDIVNVCYLGSINNIIDISLINDLLASINKIKPVAIHIIGDGENRDLFIQTLKSSGIDVKFYGKIFEEDKKRVIFDQCSFGLNIMKDSVCVGLTMKSIDYFEASLPILNSIKADTSMLVEEHKIGFNLTSSNVEDIAIKVANLREEELLQMKKNTEIIFDELFSIEAFNHRLESIFNMVKI